MKCSSVVSKLDLKLDLKQDKTGLPAVKKYTQGKTGDVVLVEVMSKNTVYPYLEQTDGTLSIVEVGDKIIGALGAREALRGFVGHVPTVLDNPDVPLALLNMGGVIGQCTDAAVGLGAPPVLKYLGTLVDDQGIININRVALPHSPGVISKRHIILILGTCMNVGKTSNAVALIQAATKAGQKVGAAKLAGVAALKDLHAYQQAGAIDVKSFLDCGLPSTVDADDLAQMLKNILNVLQGETVIIELGDGIMGHYKVDSVLEDKNIMSHVSAVIVCAADLTAAYGAKHYLDQIGVPITAVSGPATDNIAGVRYITEKWGIPAINGFKSPDELFAVCWSKK